MSQWYFQLTSLFKEVMTVLSYKNRPVLADDSEILNKKYRTAWIKFNKYEKLFWVRWSPDSLRIRMKWEYKSESAIWLQCGLPGDHRLPLRTAPSSITDELLFLLTCYCPLLKNKRMKWNTEGRKRWGRDPWGGIIGSVFWTTVL